MGTRLRHSPLRRLAAGAALAIATVTPASAQLIEAPGALSFEIAIAPNTRAEVYLGAEPQLLLVCLIAGSRVTIDISSQRNSRSTLERDECVLVGEREVFATVSTSDPPATIEVTVPRL